MEHSIVVEAVPTAAMCLQRKRLRLPQCWLLAAALVAGMLESFAPAALAAKAVAHDRQLLQRPGAGDWLGCDVLDLGSFAAVKVANRRGKMSPCNPCDTTQSPLLKWRVRMCLLFGARNVAVFWLQR
jgi:hypothetical protein